jgi:hypothetical protein
VPAASISAEGSGLVRSPPATVWRLTLDTSIAARQEAPPSTDRNERIWDWLALFIGTSTVPLGRTSGWPPRPVALSPLLRAGPQVSPPLLEVYILIRLPSAVLSHSV